MKILVVGDGHSLIHEVSAANALTQLGHQVSTFYWNHYFQSRNYLINFFLKIQNKFIYGSRLTKFNADLIDYTIHLKPDMLFIYRGTHVYPKTLSDIKNLIPKCHIYGYNNDDPFSLGHPFWLWRHFLACVNLYDLLFAYRRHNVKEYMNIGAKRVELLMPWFIAEKDKPMQDFSLNQGGYDVVFVGHFEKDDRIQYIKKLAESPFKFGLFGPNWNRAPNFNWLNKYKPILPVFGDAYRQIITSSKIGICLFSKLNRDTYTRRCFEIPAMGVFLLCQYSEDIAKIFEDKVDAVFFHDPEDMIKKTKFYLEHDDLRIKIAASGRSRVISDGHDAVSRMNYVVSFVK